jgi:hypothetical protein
MTLRIALLGTGGVGKTTLCEWIQQQVEKSVSSNVKVLGSATRHVAEIFDLDVAEDGNSWLSLYSALQRRLWMAEYDDQDVVLSERCTLDEVAYQIWLIESRKKTALALGDELTEVIQAQFEIELNLAASVLQVLIHQALDDLLGYWDFVYFKPPLRSVEIEDDGFRSLSVEYRDEIDTIMLGLITELISEIPGVSDKIRVLPPDLNDSKKFLVEEIENWQTVFSS